MEDDQRVSPQYLTEEGDRQIQPEVDQQENQDHENNEQRNYDNLCRLCGKVLENLTIVVAPRRDGPWCPSTLLLLHPVI